jgi:hypothetical protein
MEAEPHGESENPSESKHLDGEAGTNECPLPERTRHELPGTHPVGGWLLDEFLISPTLDPTALNPNEKDPDH